MNACVCAHGQEVLNKNSLYLMEKKLDDKQLLPSCEEPAYGRHEMFSVRSRILKSDESKATDSSNSLNCNGLLDNSIGEESSGVYFSRKLDEEEQRISKLCFTVQLQMWENSPPEEVRGKIRAAVGKARLLMTSKFKQFKDLCDLNAGITIAADGKIPTKADLEGFWDLVNLQIVDVDSNFVHIQKLRKNGWVEEEPENGYITTMPNSPSPKGDKSPRKKTPQSRGSSPRQRKSSTSKEEETKKRQEARKRLAEAKKAARKRFAQSSPVTDGDVIICSPSPKKSE